MADSRQDHFAIAVEQQQKFEQYLIGLTFTVLGLSIQTARFGPHTSASVLELIAWLLLLVSGLIGLSRWEKSPSIYEDFGHIDNRESIVHEIKAGQQRGRQEVEYTQANAVLSNQDALTREAELLRGLKSRVEEKSSGSARRYRWQRRFFIAGFAVLATARAIGPIADIVSGVRAS